MAIQRPSLAHIIMIALALLWTGLILYLMLTPGEDTPAEAVSRFFGGTDATDWVGHVILFGGLMGVWYQALSGITARAKAWQYALVISLVVGISTESAQSAIVNRGTAFWDYIGNVTGILLVAWGVRYWS